MKIVFVVSDLSNTRIGGISRVATEIGAELVSLGNRVIAYVLARPETPRVKEYRGIELRYVDQFATLNPDYPVVEFSRRAFVQLCKDAEKEKFDLVHSFNLNGVGAVSGGGFRKLGIPLVMSSYETVGMDVAAKWEEFRSLPSMKLLAQIVFEMLLALFYEKRYLKVAQRIITEDENTRTALVAMGIEECRIRLIASGVDVDGARKVACPDVDVLQGSRGPVIGYVGRVDPRKGVQYLVMAMVKVKERYPEVVLFLAGGSRHGYDGKIRQLVRENGLEQQVRFLGRINGDILPYYQLADIIVIPSLSEGIPITLGEAMACQVPVVITRLPGVVPFLRPAEMVQWANIADHQSLAEAILRALDDPLRNVRVSQSLNFISAYTWNAVTQRHLATYAEVVAAHHS